MFQFSLYILRQTELATHSEIHHIHLTCLSQWKRIGSEGVTLWQLLKVSERSATVPSSDHSDYGQTCWDWAHVPGCLRWTDHLLTCDGEAEWERNELLLGQAPEMSELVVTKEKSSWTQQYRRINTLTKITRINYKKSNFVYKENI